MRGKELEINICGPMINNLVLLAVPTKEDSLFTFHLTYSEEPVIQIPAMKAKPYLKILTSKLDESRFGHSMTEAFQISNCKEIYF